MAVTDHSKALEIFKCDSERLGLADNYLFATSFERYQTQVDILQRLKHELDESEATVKREYVKGAASEYANPLLSEIYKASAAADRTCSLLAKLKAAAEANADNSEDDEL